MTDVIIPDDIRLFLVQNIDSIAQWEGLLLLRGTPEKEWGVDEAATRLYISQEEALRLLTPLVARHILVATEKPSFSFRYHPKKTELEILITRAAELYRRHLIPITHIIHSTKNRVQQFADAFRIRKD
jgi:hypothetical protein